MPSALIDDLRVDEMMAVLRLRNMNELHAPLGARVNAHYML